MTADSNSTDPLPTFPEMTDTAIAATAMHVAYGSLVEAGFTERQALYLVAVMAMQPKNPSE